MAAVNRVSRQPRRCSHPKCGEVIPAGEEHVIDDGDTLHVECAKVHDAEREARLARRAGVSS